MQDPTPEERLKLPAGSPQAVCLPRLSNPDADVSITWWIPPRTLHLPFEEDSAPDMGQLDRLVKILC